LATLFVRHKVADFAKWKRVYDEFDAERQSMGVTMHGVYQLDGDPTDVTVYHNFDTLEAAKAFAASDRLRDAMHRAGVVGQPEVWFTTRAR
jgi:hypothetical protein